MKSLLSLLLIVAAAVLMAATTAADTADADVAEEASRYDGDGARRGTRSAEGETAGRAEVGTGGEDMGALSDWIGEAPPPDSLIDAGLEPFKPHQLAETSPFDEDVPSSSVSRELVPTLDLRSLSTRYDASGSSAGFMFDVRAKNQPLVVYGLDVNVIPYNGMKIKMRVYSKEGSFAGYERNEEAWKLWMDTEVVSGGLNVATPVPQDLSRSFDPVTIPATGSAAFYVATDGPYLRYATFTEDVDRRYFQNFDLTFYAVGAAKRLGWDGVPIHPRTYCGGVHYYVGDRPAALPESVGLLPGAIVTQEPTASHVPTISTAPTASPTARPTRSPTPAPTNRPTRAPVAVTTLTTRLEGMEVKPVMVYAGVMFDLKGRKDVEVQQFEFNTYKTTELDVKVYVREGGYRGADMDLGEWDYRGGVRVKGQGMGNPTYLPRGSFEPFLIAKQTTVGVYITTDGPFLRASSGDLEGKPHAATPDLVLFQGVGKRYPINTGTISPRIPNINVGYVKVDIPTPAPTINVARNDLWVRNRTFVPVADTTIERGVVSAQGNKAQLMVDGSPERVTLLKFDISVLRGRTQDEPTQILSAKLRLFSMTKSDFGGFVSIIPGGHIDEASTTWANSPYADRNKGAPVGEFRSIWPNKFYELDITPYFRDPEGIPRYFVLRIASDSSNGVMYRSTAGESENGPRLIVNFAYDPDTNIPLAREFGSAPPTPAPTVVPEWADAQTPQNPERGYFNYNPRSNFGPDRWHRVAPDGYYDGLRNLKTDARRNRCSDGRRQSPRNLCRTGDECLEYHETRHRRGQYGLGLQNETLARPTPKIMSNKLRLIYKERRSEWEFPIPPGADFARNGLNSGVQDLVHIDFHVPSEHQLCNRQYDAEMQQFYLHKYGNLEAIAVLINARGEHNDHFQILLDYFQRKFDGDARLCKRRQRRARALMINRDRRHNVEREGGENPEEGQSSKLRGSASFETTDSKIDAVIEEETMDDEGNEVAPSPPSLGSMIYQQIRGRILSLTQSRRTATEKRWDPMEPMSVLKTVHFWGYSGSVTEPPCLENVKWRVMDVPMTISPTQYIKLKRLMFDHVDPDTCRKTSVHYDESNARPVQPHQGGATYRCRRSDYASDAERAASGRRKGFVLREKWWGVDNFPYFEGEFPNV